MKIKVNRYNSPTNYNFLPYSKNCSLKNRLMTVCCYSRSLLLASIDTLAILALKITYACLALFGCSSCTSASKINKQVKKLQAIRENNLNLLTRSSFAISKTVNVARKKHIWKSKDAKRAEEYFRKYNGTLSINGMHARGAIKKGVCFGASLTLAAEICAKNIQTEKELSNYVHDYKDGFSAEASGIQRFYESLTKKHAGHLYPVDEALTIVKDIYCECFKALNVSLKVSAKQFFYTQACDKVEFNALPYGVYNLYTTNHVVLFFKKPFGTYMIDPNFGLIKCHPQQPIETIHAFFTKKYDLWKNSHKLNVFAITE